jgi:rhomboid protease GluP
MIAVTMKNFLSTYIPVVTLSMTTLLILCFVFQSEVGAKDGNALLASLFGISGSSVHSGHLPRLITANFFHVNRGHLVSNIIGLLFFSSFLEILLGRSRIILVILLSAIGGTIGSLLFHMVDWMVGSSTILFGVFGGLGVLTIKYRKQLNRLFITIVISWCIGLILMSTLGYLSLESVDQGAHVGGFLAGILSTLILVYPHSIKEISNPLSLKERVFLIMLLTVFGLSFIKEVVLFL